MRGQRTPDGEGSLTSDAGVDLVEDQGRRRRRQHEPHRQHRPGQLPAGGDSCERQQSLARVGPEKELDVVRQVALADRYLDASCRQRKLVEMRLDLSSERRRRLAPELPDPALGCGQGAAEGLSLVLELLPASPRTFDLLEPVAQLAGVGQHLGDRVAVLAHQVAEQAAACLDSRQPLWILFETFRHRPQI